MAITKEQAIDILDKFDFFQGQRAGRELWNDKPYEVQEEDIKAFSRDVAELKAYIADVVPKSEVEMLQELYTDSQKKWEKAYEELEIETERLKKSMLLSYYSACTEEEAIKIGKEYGRAEVAREVISDVIEILNDAYRKCDNKEIKTILVIVNAITELKKKYTE